MAVQECQFHKALWTAVSTPTSSLEFRSEMAVDGPETPVGGARVEIFTCYTLCNLK